MFNQVRVAVSQVPHQVINYVRTVAGLSTSEPVARVQVFNAARVAGIASRVSEQLTNDGFTVDAPADFVGDPQVETVIYDVTGHPEQAAKIAQRVAGRVVVGLPPISIRSSADIIVVVGTDTANP